MGYQQRLADRRKDESRVGLRDALGRSLTPLRPFEEYLDAGLAMIGSPDEVTEGLARYLEETGFTRVMVLMALAGLPPAAALRSMDLFAARVMPQLMRGQPAVPPVDR